MTNLPQNDIILLKEYFCKEGKVISPVSPYTIKFGVLDLRFFKNIGLFQKT